MEGPGVYYLAVREHGEFYVVEQASPIISDAAKSYGKRHPDYAGLSLKPLAYGIINASKTNSKLFQAV